MSTFYGISGLTQLNDESDWNSRTGDSIVRPYTGTPSKIVEAATAARQQGLPYSIRPSQQEGGEWELRVSYGAEETQPENEPLTDTWELDGNTLDKELWELPFVRAEFASMRDDLTGNPTGDPKLFSIPCINWVRKNVEAFVRGDSKTTTLDPAEVDLTFANLWGYALAYGFHEDALNRLLHLYARGVKVFPVSQFVMRRTRIIANNFNRNNLSAIYTDVFKRRNTSSLKTSQDIPDTIRFVVPEGQWVKQTPDIKQITSTKWSVSEEWWHADEWEQEIYGNIL